MIFSSVKKDCFCIRYFLELADVVPSLWYDRKGAGHDHQRYHESLSNLTTADVYFERGQAMFGESRRIKEKTMQSTRLQNRCETV
jgi:hypothetical protein